jgi:hypothetical protein
MLLSLRGIVALILILLCAGLLTAGDTTTPTPAPSKTPMPIPTAASEMITTRPLARAFTQADLSVLVGNVQRPNALSWLDGKLYTVCNGDWTIYQIDTTTETTITYVSGVRDAHQLYSETVDNGFVVWIPDFEVNTLYQIDQRRRAPQRITSDSLDGPWGIVRLDDDTMLVSNLRADNLVTVDAEGNVQIAVTGLRSPAGLAADEKAVYVANVGSNRRAIEWLDKATLATAPELKPLVSGLQNVSVLAMGGDGYLYFAYALGTRGVVGRIQPEQCQESGCTADQVEIVVFTELQAPLAGLAISPDMELFIHTIYRPEIYRIKIYE